MLDCDLQSIGFETILRALVEGSLTDLNLKVVQNPDPYSIKSHISTGNTNPVNVKASAGKLYGVYAVNTGSAPVYLKFHNASGAPVAGTTPVTHRWAIPANTNGAGFTIPIPDGVEFDTGIGFTITGAVADADTTAITADKVVLNLLYK